MPKEERSGSLALRLSELAGALVFVGAALYYIGSVEERIYQTRLSIFGAIQTDVYDLLVRGFVSSLLLVSVLFAALLVYTVVSSAALWAANKAFTRAPEEVLSGFGRLVSWVVGGLAALAVGTGGPMYLGEYRARTAYAEAQGACLKCRVYKLADEEVRGYPIAEDRERIALLIAPRKVRLLSWDEIREIEF